ncbi:MAG: gluconokinase [Burkholderiales bacterium]|nr:gluconokinase [Burkholderiales bacterium]
MRKADSPLRIIVMGVSGSGKSTLAEGLSKALSLPMKDGDALHLPESVTKMSVGIALEDADRWPWLDRIASYLAHKEQSTEGVANEHCPQGNVGAIVSCSALKRIYRDRIRQQAGPVVFLFLDGSPELIRQRMQERKGHYMQAGLLDSQLQTLEKPGADEHDVITLTIDQSVSTLLANSMVKLDTYLDNVRSHPEP